MPSSPESFNPAARRSLPAHPPIIGAASLDAKVFKPLSPDEAVKENERIPIAALPNPAASPFRLVSNNPQDYSRALACLSQAIYFEARGERQDGERAVAQVVLNRMRHPAFPKTVCGVVFEGYNRTTGCQFTFTCERGNIDETDPRGRHDALKIAARALAGEVYGPVGLSTHYHAAWVVPYWADSLVKTAVVGKHIFYRWAGWAQPRFFRGNYAGNEPDTAKATGSGSLGPPLETTSAQPLAPQIVTEPVSRRPVTGDAKSPVAADQIKSKLLADQGGRLIGDDPNDKPAQSRQSSGSETPLPGCGPAGLAAAARTSSASTSAKPVGAAQPICH